MTPDARHARVAKATTAVNLGAALSARGRRVLLVYLDHQQDLSYVPRGLQRARASSRPIELA
jgi:nitrogenase subunit NifH